MGLFLLREVLEILSPEKSSTKDFTCLVFGNNRTNRIDIAELLIA